MRKAAEYRDRADECRKLSKSASNPEHRAMLTRMAEIWESLARDRRANMARQRRLADLDSQTKSTG